MDWCESVGKADMLSDNFVSKQSVESGDLPLTCHPSPSLITFAFWSSDVRRLLLEFYPYGSTAHWVGFLFFVRELLMLWPLVLVMCFCGLLETRQCHPNSKRSTVLL